MTKKKNMKISATNLAIVIPLFLLLTTGCGMLRSEFYREETCYLYNQGNQAYKAGEFDMAFEYFQKVAKIDPGYARAFSGLGNLALIRGDFDEAEQCYARAISLEPGLEDALLPLLLAVKEQKVRQPLLNCDIDLGKVLRLLSIDREKELENLLSGDVPLDLLASDTGSLTPEKMTELAGLIVEICRADKGPPRCRLFFGYFLYYSHQHDRLAARVIEDVVQDLSKTDRQDAYALMGRLYERMGQENRAVSACLKAVEAGRPLSEMAPFLADIYGLPLEEITKVPPSLPENNSKETEAQAPSVDATALSSGTVGR